MSHRPKTLLWLFLLLCGPGGCQTAPQVIATPAPKSPPLIRLCGHEVPAEANAVQEEVLRHLAPGLPVETAQAHMEELGFHCLYGGMFKTKPVLYHPARTLPELIFGRNAKRDKHFHSLVCQLSRNEIGTWGQRHFAIILNLPYDEQGNITEVEVAHVWSMTSRYASFFAHRSEFREPIGLPVEQAQAAMEAQKFQCAQASPEGAGRVGQPYLDCYAFDETPLGGRIVRVRLFYDETRKVTEAEVVQKPGAFDELRCMLPNSSDTLAGGVLKAVVFPARLYAAVVVGGLCADLAMARP